MMDVIKSYLVSLGFSVDKASYQEVTKVMGGAEQSIAKFAGSAVTQFATAGLAVTTFAVTAVLGISNFLDKLAQADLETEKLARQMWLSKDAAAAYSNTLKAMDVTLQDLYLSPELMRNFQELNKEARNLKAPAEFFDQMKEIRAIRFEFTKLKLEATYSLQWIGYYLIKYLESPITQIKQTLQEVNGVIIKEMPSWTKIIAQVMSWFARMGIAAFRALKDIIQLFGDLSSQIPRNLKLIGAAVTAFGLILSTGPVGIFIASLLALILLLDDFYTYIDGGDSQFGPFWQKLLDLFEGLNGSGFFEGFKTGAKDAFEAVSKIVDGAGARVKEFWKTLGDNGALDNVEKNFRNIFSVIDSLVQTTTGWIKGMYTELEKQGSLTDLLKNLGNVLLAVTEVDAAITGLIKEFLGLKETKSLLGGIGEIMKTVVVTQFKILNGLLEGIAGYLTFIAKLLKGDLLSFFSEKGDEADKRITDKQDPTEGIFQRTLQSALDIFTGDFSKNTDLRDGVIRALGRMSKDLTSQGLPGSSAPSYTLPTANTINNKTNSMMLNPTYNIYGSEPQATANAVQTKTKQLLGRNMSGVVR